MNDFDPVLFEEFEAEIEFECSVMQRNVEIWEQLENRVPRFKPPDANKYDAEVQGLTLQDIADILFSVSDECIIDNPLCFMVLTVKAQCLMLPELCPQHNKIGP
jgi:hypothetical protein